MSRAMTLSFFIMTLMFSITMLHQINGCYQYGDAVVGCPDDTATAHPFIPFDVTPIFGYEFRDAENNVVNATDQSYYNSTLKNTVNFDPAPNSLLEGLAIFSFVINAGKFMVNSFFMPLFGFPAFLQQFSIPQLATIPIGTTMFIIQVVGLFEFVTGREVFRK